MKKLLFVGALAFTGLMMAQENSIKANPAAILGGTDLVSYERKLGDRFSGVVGLGYGGYKFGGFKYKSMGAGLQGRYYFDEAMMGFYGAAVVDYVNGKTELDSGGFNFTFDDGSGTTGSADTSMNSEIKFNAFGGGLRAGYQWIFDSGITLDLNLGASYRVYKYDYKNSAEEMRFDGTLKANGVLPSGAIGIGYSF